MPPHRVRVKARGLLLRNHSAIQRKFSPDELRTRVISMFLPGERASLHTLSLIVRDHTTRRHFQTTHLATTRRG